MSLIKCPECNNDVSDSAVACPVCGFGVAAYVKKQTDEKQALEEFQRNHKKVEFTQTDWIQLFKTYEYCLERLRLTASQLPKYKSIWYENGVPSFPIGFCNSWWNCLCDGYNDICKVISKELTKLSIPEMASNAKSVISINVGDIIRPIMLRWNKLVMDPFSNNSPAILKQAEHNYNLEVAENSSMGFGIITNSLTSIALYAVQSSMKEVRAESAARANRESYINQSMTNLQQNVTRAWVNNFDKFIEDTELCHQVFMFEIGERVFKGYLFSWGIVDKEFLVPGNKEKLHKMLEEEKQKQESAKAVESKSLKTKRDAYIEREQAFVNQAENEYMALNAQIEELGFALFGEKGRKKKELKEKAAAVLNSFTGRKNVLEATKRNTNYQCTPFSFKSYSPGKLEKYEVRGRTVFDMVFDSTNSRYVLYDENGTLVYTGFPEVLRDVGVYKKFKCRYDNYTIQYEADGRELYEFFFAMTNDF